MLAEEVRTGKLGGICSLNTPASSAVEAGNPDSNSAPRLMAQCDLCGASGLALPFFEATSFQPAVPGEVCAFSDGTRLCNAVPGLPFGRGPPSGENQGLALA